MRDNKAPIGLAIVGIIGFVILFHNINQGKYDKTILDLLTLEVLGWLLVGNALALGMMYAIAPIPIRLNQESKWPVGTMQIGGGNAEACIGCIGGELDNNQTAEDKHVLDNVVLTK